MWKCVLYVEERKSYVFVVIREVERAKFVVVFYCFE